MALKPIQLDGGKCVNILHFNDVYNIEAASEEPVGGAARFCTAIKSFSHLNPLILFSGDIFAPSFLSTFTKGEQMVPVLNAIGVHCSVFGNHDFDFGIEELVKRAKGTNCTWLMSNVINNETGRPLAEGKGSLVMDWLGVRIGIIGLVEREWLETLASIDPGHVTYTDYVESGRTLARNLKQAQGCQLVIALTHMRTPNDERLAREVEEIDLILGGHDHVDELINIQGRYVIKSGTDFRHFSHIKMQLTDSGTEVDSRLVGVTCDFAEDEQLALALNEFSDVVGKKMNEVLGTFNVPLDGRFSSIRTSETNLGNFICDIMIAATDSDLALLNSGTLRSDRIHPAGPFTLRDLHSILPMLDPLIVIEISGDDLMLALENAVSQYPKLEGRFLQVGGIHFAFDPAKPSGQRVDKRFVRIGDEYLESSTMYRMVTKAYMCAGKDGYDVLKKAKVLVDEEESTMLCTAVQNHFAAIESMCGKFQRQTHHRQSLVTLSRRHSMARTIDGEFHSGLRRIGSVDPSSVQPTIAENGFSDAPSQERKTCRLQRQSSIEDIELSSCKLEPVIEGRIVVLNEENLPGLVDERLRWDVSRCTIPTQ